MFHVVVVIFQIGLVDSLTLPNVHAIRGILNSSLLDVMYYLSPAYGPEVLMC